MLTFNQSVFDETKRYWTGKTINIKMAAKARLARIKTSKATNPTYSMSELGDAFTYGESAAYVVVFGDKKSGTVKRSWVEWLFGKYILNADFVCFDAFFLATWHDVWGTAQELTTRAEHEQFPQHLGWRRPAELFQAVDLDHYMEEMQNITKAIEGPGGPRVKRENSHFGW